MPFAQEILTLLEQFEGMIDTYNQSFKKNIEEIIGNLSQTWKKLKQVQTEIEGLNEKIREQNSEITELNTESERLDNQIEQLESKKSELNSEVTQLKAQLEDQISKLKQPEFELKTLKSNFENTNEKLTAKKVEKEELERKKLENQQKEKELKEMYSGEKMELLNSKLETLKKDHFFTSFLMEHSEEELTEVDIIAKIIEKGGEVNLDDLKSSLDLLPIMLTRTIKKLAVKGIINLNEDTNVITMT
jgi:chromosome segregation ATPase